MIQDSIPTLQGLSQVEAARRLQTDGFNELASAKPRSPLLIALDVVREPMFLLLLICAIVYLFLGDKEEALMLMSAVFVIGARNPVHAASAARIDCIDRFSPPRM